MGSSRLKAPCEWGVGGRNRGSEEGKNGRSECFGREEKEKRVEGDSGWMMLDVYGEQ